jgi:hypothetical protein
LFFRKTHHHTGASIFEVEMVEGTLGRDWMSTRRAAAGKFGWNIFPVQINP